MRAAVPARRGAWRSSIDTRTRALPSRTSSPETPPAVNPSIWARLPAKRLVAWGNTKVT